MTGGNNITDTQLVKNTLENSSAFGAIVEQYEAPLARYINRLARLTREDTEDLLQEIFLKVYCNLNDYDEGLKLSSWIYRIAHNETISWFRKRSIRPEGNYVAMEDSVYLNIAGDVDAVKDAESRITAEAVGAAMQSLPKKYREVLVLFYFEDKRYEEISDILKKPPGTIATLMNRGKKKLKELLTHMK